MMNIVKFCSISGISGVNKQALLKQHSTKVVKEYAEWVKIVSVGYKIPNDLSEELKPQKNKVKKVEDKQE